MNSDDTMSSYLSIPAFTCKSPVIFIRNPCKRIKLRVHVKKTGIQTNRFDIRLKPFRCLIQRVVSNQTYSQQPVSLQPIVNPWNCISEYVRLTCTLWHICYFTIQPFHLPFIYLYQNMFSSVNDTYLYRWVIFHFDLGDIYLKCILWRKRITWPHGHIHFQNEWCRNVFQTSTVSVNLWINNRDSFYLTLTLTCTTKYVNYTLKGEVTHPSTNCHGIESVYGFPKYP